MIMPKCLIGEYRGASADDDASFLLSSIKPIMSTLLIRKARVEQGNGGH